MVEEAQAITLEPLRDAREALRANAHQPSQHVGSRDDLKKLGYVD